MGIPLSVPRCELSQVLERGRSLIREDGSFPDVDDTPPIHEALPVWEEAVREEIETCLAQNFDDPLPRCAILDYTLQQYTYLSAMPDEMESIALHSVDGLTKEQILDYFDAPPYKELSQFITATWSFIWYVKDLLPNEHGAILNSRWEFLFRAAIGDYSGLLQNLLNLLRAADRAPDILECLLRIARVVWSAGTTLPQTKYFIWNDEWKSSKLLWTVLRDNPHGPSLNQDLEGLYPIAIQVLKIITDDVSLNQSDQRWVYLAMLSDILALTGDCGAAALIVEHHGEDFARELAASSCEDLSARNIEIDIFQLRVTRRLADLLEAAGNPAKAAMIFEKLPGALQCEGNITPFLSNYRFYPQLLILREDNLDSGVIRIGPDWSTPTSVQQPMAFKIADLWEKAGDLPKAIRTLKLAVAEGETPPRHYHELLSCLYLKCCDTAMAYAHLRSEEEFYPEIGEVPIVSFVLQAAVGIPGIASESRKAELEMRPPGKLQREFLAKSLPNFWPTYTQLFAESRELWVKGCFFLFGAEESGFEPDERAGYAIVDLASAVEQELLIRVFEPLQRDSRLGVSRPKGLGEMLRFFTDALKQVGPLQGRLEELAGPEWRRKLTRSEYTQISRLRNPPAHGQQSTALAALRVMELSKGFLESLVARQQVGAPTPSRAVPGRPISGRLI